MPDPVLEAAVRRLRAAGCVNAEQEASELLAASADETELDRAVARRADGEPLAWITGSMWFGGRRLHVAPGVFVPRRQTEVLARQAAAVLPRRGRVLDLCTGVGAVTLYRQCL